METGKHQDHLKNLSSCLISFLLKRESRKTSHFWVFRLHRFQISCVYNLYTGSILICIFEHTSSVKRGIVNGIPDKKRKAAEVSKSVTEFAKDSNLQPDGKNADRGWGGCWDHESCHHHDCASLHRPQKQCFNGNIPLKGRGKPQALLQLVQRILQEQTRHWARPTTELLTEEEMGVENREETS